MVKTRFKSAMHSLLLAIIAASGVAIYYETKVQKLEAEQEALQAALLDCYPVKATPGYTILHRTASGKIECGWSRKFYRPIEKLSKQWPQETQEEGTEL